MPFGIADFLLNSVAISVAEKLFSNDPSSNAEGAGAGNCHNSTTTAMGSHEGPSAVTGRLRLNSGQCCGEVSER